uniref:Uncharacterized protein n=1 Tax=Anguilla anguilla TaxID=7936 RepID=A0A0E9XAG2_ANGAN
MNSSVVTTGLTRKFLFIVPTNGKGHFFHPPRALHYKHQSLEKIKD